MYAVPQYRFFSKALPTLLGGHIHMGPPVLHPWPVRGAQLLPAQHHSCHQFCPLSQLLCIPLCASDSSPQASNHGDNLLTLRTLPEATHWVCQAGEPISSPSGLAAGSEIAHYTLPNTPLHKCSILFITRVFFFFYIFYVNERSKHLWASTRHLLHNYICTSSSSSTWHVAFILGVGYLSIRTAMLSPYYSNFRQTHMKLVVVDFFLTKRITISYGLN